MKKVRTQAPELNQKTKTTENNRHIPLSLETSLGEIWGEGGHKTANHKTQTTTILGKKEETIESSKRKLGGKWMPLA